jgi:hypothetical protein
MKIEFDEQNAKVARAIGRALLEIAGDAPKTQTITVSRSEIKPEEMVAACAAAFGAGVAAGEKPHTFTASTPEVPHDETAVKTMAKGIAAAITEQAFGAEGWQTSNLTQEEALAAAFADCCPTHEDPAPAVDLEDTPNASYAGVDYSAQRVDLHGVPFNPEFCGEAEEPFYTTGKQKGQWKKRRGVEENDYAAWYESQRPKLAPTAPTASAFGTNTGVSAEPAPLPVTNVAAAFGAPVAPVARPLPANAGELMTWCAELQAASRLTQPDITAAYADLGLALFDIFEPVAADLIAERIGKLYAILSAKAVTCEHA